MKFRIIAATFAASSLFCRLQADVIKDSYTLEYNGKYLEAMSALESALNADPKNYFLALRTGWMAYMAGKYAKSVQLYEKAILNAPDAIEPRLGLMIPQLALGQYKDVIRTATAIIRKDAKNYTARSKMAYSLYMSGSFADALKVYEGIVKDYPGDGNMIMGMAYCNLKLGNKKSSRSQFEKAKIILPYNKLIDEGLKSAN